MATYLLRRLLLMIPTFFGISLIVFVVLNLAPGRPGNEEQDGTANLKGIASQESYRIFREQFSLEKPTLLNARFTTRLEDVARDVSIVARTSEATPQERARSQDALEDLGRFAVPHLLQIARAANERQELQTRDTAIHLLELAARRPLEDPFAKNPSPQALERNRAIDRENNELRGFRYEPDADEATKQRALTQWQAWYETRRQRYEYTFTEKVGIFFLDTRFAAYWENLLKFDFGVSLVSREPVLRTLLSKLKYSLSLSVGSLVLAYLFAIPLGIFSAVRSGSKADRIVTVGLFMLYSLPAFFVATVLLVVFSEGSSFPALRLFPTGGWQSSQSAELSFADSALDVAWHLVLPVFCMTYGLVAALSRYMRAGLLEVIRSDYVRTARAKGLHESVVIGKHALRNGLMPILTLLAGLLPAALGGSVIVEYIFGIPGIGLWMVEAIYQRDYNVIMAVQLLSTILVLVGILLADLSYALVDPRIRYS